MSVLNISGVKKILGAQEILRGAELRVERGEKVGCVGRNGEGKTTLLRLIEGELTPDEGRVTLTKGARLGYVAQRPAFEAGVTVRSYVESGLEEVHQVERELEAVHELLGEAEDAALESALRRQGELTERMEFLGGWESERRVETVLAGIGLATELWDREARTLSGGEKSRTAMARELVSVPDLLLLDEPTNHLDLVGIEWIEAYLKEIHSAVLMVSHDRRLLDRVADTIVDVERGLVQRYPGNYSRYVTLKAERFASELRAWEQQQESIRKDEAFIKKHMGSQRTAEAKGRRKRLANLARVARPYNDVRKPAIRLASTERGGEQVIEAEGLRLGYGERVLLEGVSLRIGRGERIGVVGPNGSGKTTLLRVLAGRAEPQKGEIVRGYKASCGFFDQESADLRDDGTVYTEIRRDHPQMTDLEIRSHLARFLFRGVDVDLAVRRLSGGERSRLALARLVLTNPSWLALDEPTNHLDLAGRTALEEMLGEFEGALVVISHDREFLDDLTNRIVEVSPGGLRDFRGNYTDYRNQVLAEAEAAAEAERAKPRPRPPEPRKADAPKGAQASGKGEASKGSKRSKRSGRPRNPWRFKQLEEAIISLEDERTTLLDDLAREEVYRDADAMRERQVRLAEVERDLEKKNQEWETWI